MKDDRVYKFPLLPPGPGNPANSGASIIPLRDGRLFMAYSHVFGSHSGDLSACRIAARFSEDDGRTWTKEDVILVENEAELTTVAANLVRLASGSIALFYLVMNSETDCLPYMRISTDEGQTWSERVCVSPQSGYHTVNGDRVIQLSSGRLVVPASFSGGYSSLPSGDRKLMEAIIGNSLPYYSTCFLSDDDGATWRRSNTVLESPWASKSGLQEPGIIELKNGSIMMLMGTDLGGQFCSYSHDSGETWTAPQPTALIGPCSPSKLGRIPGTGDLLVIWNTPCLVSTRSLPRGTLSTAISKDEGKTWQNIKTLEHDPDASYCYLSLTFVGSTAVMTYAHRHNSFDGGMLKLTVVDVDWFYD